MLDKSINTLVDDIYTLVSTGKEASQENLHLFGEAVKAAISDALKQGGQRKEVSLRMSNIGTPPRKIWYILKGFPTKEIAPNQLISFMYGHMVEALLLFLAREAGHIVSDEQKEVVLEGVPGHMDCKINGVIIDAKGMNNYNFTKFLSSSLLASNDPFGYIPQISGYAQAEGVDAAGFLVYNKERGTLTLCMLNEFDLIDARKKIQSVRDSLTLETPPEKCFKAVPDGKSGNLMLDKPCCFCDFKEECWKDANNGQGLRKFKYSNGTKFLVKIEKEPRVDEIFNDNGTTEEEIES